jgi:hypothetical protein
MVSSVKPALKEKDTQKKRESKSKDEKEQRQKEERDERETTTLHTAPALPPSSSSSPPLLSFFLFPPSSCCPVRLLPASAFPTHSSRMHPEDIFPHPLLSVENLNIAHALAYTHLTIGCPVSSLAEYFMFHPKSVPMYCDCHIVTLALSLSIHHIDFSNFRRNML